MPGSFDGKVIIVTGASSGIGRRTAIDFAAQGGRVVVAARRSLECEQVVEEIRSRGGEASFVQSDVRSAESAQALVRATVRLYGRLDCAFNNAGIAGEGMRGAAEHSADDWDNVLATNLTGTWLCMKYEIPELLRCGGGAIVNTASIFGLAGSDLGIAPYVASKHGIVGLTRAAAIDYARKGIRVNAVCPGITESGMTLPAMAAVPQEFSANIDRNVPLGRIADPAEISSAVLWLCSDAARFVTGQTLSVDGGWLAK